MLPDGSTFCEGERNTGRSLRPTDAREPASTGTPTTPATAMR